MAKYILSDGRLSSSRTESIIDELTVRIRLWKNEIPHSSITGLDKNYNGIIEEDTKILLQSNLINLASSISDKLTIKEIIIGNYGITLNINIDNEDYELSVRN